MVKGISVCYILALDIGQTGRLVHYSLDCLKKLMLTLTTRSLQMAKETRSCAVETSRHRISTASIEVAHLCCKTKCTRSRQPFQLAKTTLFSVAQKNRVCLFLTICVGVSLVC